MITITFDESGEFEKVSAGGHIFIAGFLFDDCGIPDETETEKERIYNYYNKVCEKTGTDYPFDLHVDNNLFNDSKVALTKECVRRSLGNFLKDGVYLDPDEAGAQADTFGMSARKGKYHLFMKLRSEKGRPEFLNENSSILIKDDYASNLYIHMAEEILEEILLYNPFIDHIHEVYFDLPTRMALPEGDYKKKQYKNLDHMDYQRLNSDAEKGKKYQIGNADIYRTAIEMMLKNAEENIQVQKVKVYPILYKLKEDEKYKTEDSFLYMADSICSLIKFQPSSNRPGKWISDVNRKFNELSGTNQNLVLAYDEADVYWQKAYDAFKQNHLYETLTLISDGEKCGSSMAKYYTEVWYPLIESKVASCRNIQALEEASKKLQKSTYSSFIDQNRLFHYFEILQKAVIPFENEKEAANAVFALYDAGAALYNHTGQPQKAMECRKKSLDVSKGQDISQILRMRNRLAVSYCDALNFEEALKTVNGTIDYEQMIRDMQTEMSIDDSLKDVAEGRALSQRGQVYAFMRNPEAEKDFLNALELLGESEDDYLITLSYLLQYYLDIKEKEKYEKYAKIYFNSDDLYEQFTNLINEGCGENKRINLKFSLYIFVKAVWEFYHDTENRQLNTALLDIESALSSRKKEAKNEIGGHPWELIYKYLAFYAYNAGKPSKAKDYIQKSQSVLKDAGEIIEKINAETLKEYERLTKGEEIIDAGSPLTYMYR